MAAKIFRVGTATADITPQLGGSIVGGMTDRGSTHVHDPLHVRCLVLDNGDEQLALAVCDLCTLPGEQVAPAKHLIHSHTGIPMTHITISATHTHSGPATRSIFQSEADPVYLEHVVVRIADGVRSAVNNLQPARVGWGAAQESSQVFNRRYYMKVAPDFKMHSFLEHTEQVVMNPGQMNPNIIRPAGPVDPEVGLLAFQTPAGRPLALLGNYALHYVGGVPAEHISADYFACWAEEMRRLLGAGCDAGEEDRLPFLAILSNGCSGDINNIDVTQTPADIPPYHQMRRVARILAGAAMQTWPKIEFHDWVPLGVRETTLEFRLRKPSGADLDRAKKLLSQAPPKLVSLEHIYARENILLAQWPDTVKTVTQAMRVGDLGIVTFPGEAFVELGLAVKKQSPFAQTMCIELANDAAGYIPTPEAFQVGGYETWRARSSCLEEQAGPKMVAKAIEMLTQLKATASTTSKAS